MNAKAANVPQETAKAIPWKSIIKIVLTLILGAMGGEAAHKVIQEKPVLVADEPAFEVSLSGPSNIPDGAFPVTVMTPQGSKVRTRLTQPVGELPPLELTDNAGRMVLIFMRPLPGEHIVEVAAQQPSVDPPLDPFAEARLRVYVGNEPQPTPAPLKPPATPTTLTTPDTVPSVPTTTTPDVQPAPATAIVAILYESSDGNLPPYAIGAVNKLRAAGRDVRVVDLDVTTGLDQTPKWAAGAIVKAKAAGLPAIVLVDRETALSGVKLPATTEAIVEAVK